MRQHQPPEKPESFNGNERANALWELIMHVNGRVDRLYVTMAAGLAVLVGILAVGILDLVTRGG